MPKVLIIIARLNKGGTAQYIGELAKGLPRYGYQVLVATGYVQGHEIEDEIARSISISRIKNLGRRVHLINDLKARREIRRLIEFYKPDVIYTHTFKAGALTRTIKTEIPIIHAFHGHLIDEPELSGIRIKFAMLIERFLASKAKVLVTVGKKVAKELLEAGVGQSSQYVSIAPGVRPLKLANKKEVRKSLNLQNEKRPIISWLARVVPVKGPERVLELARQIPHAKFILAGGGDLFEKIKKSAPENLDVIGWKLASEIWAISDLAVSTSENEGMPIALIEAQLAGIPVVALNVGSVGEIIKKGKTGFLFDEFNKNYIDTVNTLSKSKIKRAKLGSAAKKYARKEFDPERLIQDHLKLFKKVL